MTDTDFVIDIFNEDYKKGLMKEITAGNPFAPEFSRIKDEASMLAKFLLKDCTHMKF